MRKCFFLTTLMLLFLSCSGEDEDVLRPEPLPDVDGITVLAYMMANNSLDYEIMNNIRDMYFGLAEMDERVTLLVYWDGITPIGENEKTHLIFKYETDGKGGINGAKALDESANTMEILDRAEIVKEYPSQLSVDKEVLFSVLSDMLALSPTERVGLIAASHASAWLNTISTSGRSFGQDGIGTSTTLLISEFVEAVERTGKTFDFMLFDACYMASLEVCYEFRHIADYQIASVMQVPGYGFPYHMFMKHLYEGTRDGYKRVCEEFVKFHESRVGMMRSWGTVALVDSEGLEPLTEELRKEIVNHKDILSDFNVNDVQEYGRNQSKYLLSDVEHFVKVLNGGEVPEGFKNCLDNAVLYKNCVEKATYTYDNVDADNFCGLGMYIPTAARPKWNAWFKTMEWFTVSGWDEVDFSWDF